LRQGATDHWVAEGAYNGTLVVTNRARRGAFSAQVVRAQLIGEEGFPIPGAPNRVPYSLPWALPKDWSAEIEGEAARHDLANGEEGRLFVCRVEAAEGELFWLLGVFTAQPYTATPGVGIESLVLGVRVYNNTSDRSWSWIVTLKFDPACEPRLAVRRTTWRRLSRKFDRLREQQRESTPPTSSSPTVNPEGHG
jgi:hypothetical protein